MSVKIAINPITWTNDDVTELGGDTPVEVCLSETSLAGYMGIELGGKFPRNSDELRHLLEPYDLQLVSGWWDGRILEQDVKAEFNAVRDHSKLLQDLGAKHVVYADTSNGRHDGIWQPISQRPILAENQWKKYGRKLTELAERMSDFGVGMAFHHHMGTIVETDDDVDHLMDVTGAAVGLLFDSGHSAFSGGDPVKLAERHAARIVHVHCKDTRLEKLRIARENDMSFMDAVLDGLFTVPGDGGLDFLPILKILQNVGYEGWLVVEAEQDPKKADPMTYASMGYTNLLALAQAASFKIETRVD